MKVQTTINERKYKRFSEDDLKKIADLYCNKHYSFARIGVEFDNAPASTICDIFNHRIRGRLSK